MRIILALLILASVPSTLCAEDLWAPVTSPPEREWNPKQLTTYRTQGHPKALGLHIRIDYLPSWATREARHPHVVQRLQSKAGRGLEFCSLSVFRRSSPVPLTPADLAELATPASLRTQVPQGARYLSGGATKIDNLPASWVEFIAEQTNAGVTTRLHTLRYLVFFRRFNLFFEFSVGGLAEHPESQLEARFKTFRPLFVFMANSVVVEDQW